MLATKHLAARGSSAPIAAAAVICTIFLGFAGDGLQAYFTPDEMMNMYGAWAPPFGELVKPAVLLSGGSRLLPTLVYRILFSFFGFDPLPYRMVCLSLLLANLMLLYRFCRCLSASREIAFLACVLGAYHAHLTDLYYSTGTIYDLLCFTFYYAALIYYMERRNSGYLSARNITAVLLLYWCALNSKEMAVSLPLIIVAYEVLYYPTQKQGRLANWQRRAILPALMSIMTVWFVLGKVAGTDPMLQNPAYLPHISLHMFLAGWRHYLTGLFYGAIRFTTLKVVLLFATLIVFILARGGKPGALSGVLIFLGALPVIFITPRGLYALYLTLPGWYLLTAEAAAASRDGVVRLADRCAEVLGISVQQLSLFVLLAGVVALLHWHQKPLQDAWVKDAHLQLRSVEEQLRAGYPSMPNGARILFLDDPYERGDWILTFLFRLNYRDRTIRVDRVKDKQQLSQPELWKEYTYVFSMDRWKLVEIRQQSP